MRRAIVLALCLTPLLQACEELGAERRTVNLDEPYTLEVDVRSPRFIDISPLLPERCECNLRAWPAPGECAESSDAVFCHCDQTPESLQLPWTCVDEVLLVVDDGARTFIGDPPQPYGRVTLREDAPLSDFDDAVFELRGCDETVRVPLVTSSRRLDLIDVVAQGDRVALHFDGDEDGDSLLLSNSGTFGGTVCRRPFDIEAPVLVRPSTDGVRGLHVGVLGLWRDEAVAAPFGEVIAYRSAGFSVPPPLLPVRLDDGRWQIDVRTGSFQIEGNGTPVGGTQYMLTLVTFEPAASEPEQTLLVVGEHDGVGTSELLSFAMGAVEDQVRLVTTEGTWAATVPHVDVEGMIRPGTEHWGEVAVGTMVTLASVDGTQPDREVELGLSLLLPPIARLP
jgi:hypothetical protein